MKREYEPGSKQEFWLSYILTHPSSTLSQLKEDQKHIKNIIKCGDYAIFISHSLTFRAFYRPNMSLMSLFTKLPLFVKNAYNYAIYVKYMVYTCNYWGSISSDYLIWACTFAVRKPTSFGFGKVGMYDIVIENSHRKC